MKDRLHALSIGFALALCVEALSRAMLGPLWLPPTEVSVPLAAVGLVACSLAVRVWILEWIVQRERTPPSGPPRDDVE